MGKLSSVSWCTAFLTFVASTQLGCKDFFREIELEQEHASAESDSDSKSNDSEDASANTDESMMVDSDTPCQIEDESCIDQDVMKTCDPDSEETLTMSCRERCGNRINISCLQIDASHHACWCQEAGSWKNTTCTELENCVEQCAKQSSDECMTRCFARTDSLTARLYGALLFCAEEECHPLCHERPNECHQCVISARSGMDGACIVERTLCDQDELEDI